MKHIILTGATGLIGSELYKQLIRRGDTVTVFVRNPDAVKNKFREAKAIVRWSATSNDSSWHTHVAGADAIIHLAGAPVSVRWSDAYKKEIMDSRVISTQNMVRAISHASRKPQVFICGSAIGYYGNHLHEAHVEAATEASSAGKDFLSLVCVAWEAEAIKAESLGIRVVRIRTGIVLSTKEGALQKMLLPFRFFVGGPIGDGKQWFSWIHIDDEVGIILKALDDDSVHGAVNATSPEALQMNAFCKTLGHVMHRPSFFSIPKFVLQLLFSEAADTIASGQKVFPKKILDYKYQFRYPHIEMALHDVILKKK